MGNRLFIFFSIILFYSCKATNKKVAPAEYVLFIEDEQNDYKVILEAGAYIYTFQYKPSEYIALKEMEGLNVIDTVKYRNRLHALENTVWFNVYVEAANSNVNPVKNNLGGGMDEYNNRIAYFLNEARNSFTLYYGKDVMPQVGYNFENNYGLTPKDVMVIGFKIPDAQPKDDLTIEYNDKLFKNELLKVKITKSQLLNIPTVIF
jgi:hypothetical protein